MEWPKIDKTNVANNIGKALQTNTMVLAIWPYKVYRPGDSKDGKWVYKIVELSNVTTPHQFAYGNYYARINSDILSNNPKIIQNPNQ